MCANDKLFTLRYHQMCNKFIIRIIKIENLNGE